MNFPGFIGLWAWFSSVDEEHYGILSIIYASFIAILLGVHWKRRKKNTEESINESFPNTKAIRSHWFYTTIEDLPVSGKYTRFFFATFLELILSKLKFKEVNVGEMRERVFDYKLKYGHTVRILSGIRKGNKQWNPFCRGDFKVGILDENGQYVLHEPYQVPMFAVVDNTKGYADDVLDELLKGIDNVCNIVKEQYDALDNDHVYST